MTVFEGRDIRVVARLLDTRRKDLVVTFTGRAANPPVEKGFGEVYLAKKGISAIHFISKANHWWQTPEPLEAIERLKRDGFLPDDRRLVLYGSSMGGYAALIYSRILKPDQVIIFSPQYSIDANKVPFEKRWRNYAAKVRFDHDDMVAGLDVNVPVKVIFDPFFEPDARHVGLIEAVRPIERVSIPFAGHNTARVLGELNMITETTDSLILGGFEKAVFSRRYRRERESASLFWHGFSETLFQHQQEAGGALAAVTAAVILEKGGRMRDRVLRLDILHAGVIAARLLDRADLAAAYVAEIKAAEPNGHRTPFAEAVVFQMTGNLSAAIASVQAALAGKSGDADYLALLAELLVESGRVDEAMPFIAGLPSAVRQSTRLLVTTAKAWMAQGRFIEAKEVLRLACRDKRRNVEARVLLARCWALTGRPDAAPKQLDRVLDRVVANPALAKEIVELLLGADAESKAGRFAARQARFQAICDAVLMPDPIGWGDVPQAAARMRSRARSAALLGIAPNKGN